MKAHQNQNMNYDEMHEYGMFNESGATCARHRTVNMLNTNILFKGSYERNVLASRLLYIIILAGASLPPTVGGKPSGLTCQP